MTFQEQNDLLLKSYIENYVKPLETVEFIFSSECDQKCEYCYLQKHFKEMNYPRANKKEDILHNLKLFLDYLEEQDFQYKTYDIFSGEFFNLSYWEDIFQIFYEHQLSIGSKDRVMVIPTNYSFIADDEKIIHIEEWINKMLSTNCYVHLSCSIDGPEETDNSIRPNFNNKVIKNNAFYDKVFSFVAKHNYAFHPMISKHFLENYKDNYDWFIDNIAKYDICFYDKEGRQMLSAPMLLEVRDNDEWDEHSLKLYKDFLNYVFEKDLHVLYKDNLRDIMYRVFDDHSDLYEKMTGVFRCQPYILAYPSTCGNKMSCSIQKHLVCRLGDLTMAPCHRLYYPEFEYGRFITNEDRTKIIGVEGYNPTLAFKIATLNPTRSNLKCGGCKYRGFCLQGCLGSQYEETSEIFGFQDKVCEMFKIKYETIHEICEKYKLYDMALNDEYIPSYRKEYVQYVRGILSEN